MNDRPEVDVGSQVLLGKGGPSAEGWHKIEAMYRCAKEYQLRVVRGVKTPLAQQPDALAGGSFFHAMRARWFASRFGSDENTWAKVRQAALEEAERFSIPASDHALVNAQVWMQEYINHYLQRPRPKVIAAEYLVGPSDLFKEHPGFSRTARLDDVSIYPEAGNVLCVGEAKTSSDIHNTVKEYTMHGQPGLQLILWHLFPEGAAKFGVAKGIMLDILQKPGGKGKSCKFLREFVEYPERVLKWHAQNMLAMLKAAQKIKWDTEAPRNITSCTRMIGKARVNCEFMEACRFGKSVAQRYVDEKGRSLVSWKPGPNQTVHPLE